MPELPEVESVRRQLQPELAGRRVVAVWADTQRRFHAPDRLLGRTVAAVGRRGKFLLCPLDQGLELVLHLGMTGVLHFGVADAYARARITLDDGRELVFRDVRRFGALAVVEAGAYEPMPSLARLGPEPLSEAFDPARFARGLAVTRAPVKPYLLSQRPVAGVGNIYADEALWRARIHGDRPGDRLTGPQVRALLGHAREVMTDALGEGGTSFDSLYVNVNGESGYFDRSLDAYGRGGEPCRRCGTPIRRVAFMNRSSYFCPRCQPPPRRRRSRPGIDPATSR
jgi:formamidopyrimidine-DNA glycosylase